MADYYGPRINPWTGGYAMPELPHKLQRGPRSAPPYVPQAEYDELRDAAGVIGRVGAQAYDLMDTGGRAALNYFDQRAGAGPPESQGNVDPQGRPYLAESSRPESTAPYSRPTPAYRSEMPGSEAGPAETAPPAGGADPYRKIVEDYLGHMQQDVRLPERKPYTSMEALAITTGPPQVRAMIERQHNAPYERELAELQFNERRRGGAAAIAGQLQAADQTAAYRAGEMDRFRSKADYNEWLLRSRPDADREAKLPKSKEDALKQIESEITGRQSKTLSAQSGMFNMDIAGDMLSPERKEIIASSQQRISELEARRDLIRAMNPNQFEKFRKLDGEDQQAYIDFFAELEEGDRDAFVKLKEAQQVDIVKRWYENTQVPAGR